MIESFLNNLQIWVSTWASQSLENIFIALPLYFLAGLLGSFFPCLYPLYPITAGFLKNRTQKGEKVWKHPILYSLGMVSTYFLLGLIASSTGSAFNAIMQNPFAILMSGFLFLFLAFVSLDWYTLNLDLGQRWNTYLIQKNTSLASFLMGNVAGLIGSACTAPVIVSMLVIIAQNQDPNLFELNKVFYSGLLSLSFGVGISLPFFITGVLGAKLPKSGKWQILIKYFVGILIAVIAFYQFEKALLIFQWSSSLIYSFFLILLFLFILCFLSFQEKRILVIAYLCILGLLFTLALLGKYTYGQKALLDEYEEIGTLQFYRQANFAFSKAKQEKKAIFIDFYGKWCTNCKEFEKNLEKDTSFQAGLKKAILLKIYDTDNDFQDFLEDSRFPELKIGLPFFLVLDSEGKEFWKTTNYLDTKGMIEAIEKLSP